MLAAGLMTLVACDNTLDLIQPHTWLIFPYEEGSSRITAVIDTTFEAAGPVEDRYYKQETIANEEQDLTGRTLRRLLVDRSEWANGSEYDWQRDRVWALHKPDSTTGDYFVERIEENRKILILKFPVYEGVSWNGNLFNQEDFQEFRYFRTDTTVTVAAGTFENCVMVVQKADTTSFIRDAFAYEIYAPEVGLIKKYDKTMVFDGPNTEFNPSASRIYLEELIQYDPPE